MTEVINYRNGNLLERHIQALLKLEDAVILLQLSKIRQITEKERSRLRYFSGLILRDLIYEIIRLQDKPTSVNFIVEKLLNIEDEFLVSTGYLTDLNIHLEKASEIMDSNFTPGQFIRELLEARRTEKEKPKKIVLRFLPPYSGRNHYLKIDEDLFGLRIWPQDKFFETYVQIASKYRNNNPYKKEIYKEKAIQLLELHKIDIPDKINLIKTIRRL